MDALVHELRGLLEPALREAQEDPIHDARVATRRLKAALDVLEPALGRPQLKYLLRATRRLRRTLGPLRDADVMLSQLEPASAEGEQTDAKQQVSEQADAADTAPAAPPGVPGAGRLKSDLRRERERLHRSARRAKLIRRIDEGLSRWIDLRREVVGLSAVIDTLVITAVHERLDAVEAEASALASATSDEVRPDPHALRLAGKRLRYTMEIAVEQELPLPQHACKLFKRMQSALGDWHDAVMLAEYCVADLTDDKLAYHDPHAFAENLDIARDAIGRAEEDLQRFLALWAEQGPALAQEIRQALIIAPPVEDAPAPAADTHEAVMPEPDPVTASDEVDVGGDEGG